MRRNGGKRNFSCFLLYGVALINESRWARAGRGGDRRRGGDLKPSGKELLKAGMGKKAEQTSDFGRVLGRRRGGEAQPILKFNRYWRSTNDAHEEPSARFGGRYRRRRERAGRRSSHEEGRARGPICARSARSPSAGKPVVGFTLPGSDTCMHFTGYIDRPDRRGQPRHWLLTAFASYVLRRRARRHTACNPAFGRHASTHVTRPFGYTTRLNFGFDAVSNTSYGPLVAHCRNPD